MLLSDRGADIDFTIEGAACIIVTTVDETLCQICIVRNQVGILTLCQPVHISLIDITGIIGTTAVCSAKDATNLDGRTIGHIDHRTTGNTFLVTATVCGTYLSTHQIDDSGSLVDINGSFATRECVSCWIAHTQSIISSCTKDLCVGEILNTIGDVDQHVAVVLSLIAITIARISLTGTEDLLYRIVDMRVRSEIDESIA